MGNEAILVGVLTFLFVTLITQAPHILFDNQNQYMLPDPETDIGGTGMQEAHSPPPFSGVTLTSITFGPAHKNGACYTVNAEMVVTNSNCVEEIVNIDADVFGPTIKIAPRSSKTANETLLSCDDDPDIEIASSSADPCGPGKINWYVIPTSSYPEGAELVTQPGTDKLVLGKAA